MDGFHEPLRVLRRLSRNEDHKIVQPDASDQPLSADRCLHARNNFPQESIGCVDSVFIFEAVEFVDIHIQEGVIPALFQVVLSELLPGHHNPVDVHAAGDRVHSFLSTVFLQ